MANKLTMILTPVITGFATLCVLVAIKDAGQEEKAVAAAMNSLNESMKQGSFSKLDMEAIDISETPEDFQKAFLQLKQQIANFKNRPKYVIPKGEKYDTMKALGWLQQYMDPVLQSYELLELRAAEYVPEIKEKIKMRSQFRREMNDIIHNGGK